MKAMRNEGNCNKLSFFNILSAVLIVSSFIALQSAYGASWDYARTYSGNERKQSILRATRKALAILQKSKRAIALEEEAMLPHHCSFIKLRTLAFSDDVGSICVNGLLRNNEYGVDGSRYCLASIPPLGCRELLFYIAVAYCYERFYYHQREAYPQSNNFYLVLSIHSSLLPHTHSGNKWHTTQLQDYTCNVYLTDNNHTSIELVAVVTLLCVFLPVTIAHIKPTLTITKIIPRGAL